MEVIFFFRIGTEFLTDFQDKDLKIIRDFEKIVMRYLKGQFIFDFITVIPFDYFIMIEGGYSRLFYLLKLLRLFQGLQLFDVQRIMILVNKYYKNKIDNIIKNDPDLAENVLVDNNNISKLI